MDVNIFVQVGFVVLVGLAAKNAILIVEFARDRQQRGCDRVRSRRGRRPARLRPIIMTSFAFILGVLPLVIAEGAGAEMRRTLGHGSLRRHDRRDAFGIFLTPVFYSVVMWLVERKAPRQSSRPRPRTCRRVNNSRAGRTLAVLDAPHRHRIDGWRLGLRAFGRNGERRGLSPPVQALTGGLTPRRSPPAMHFFRTL